MKRYDVRPSVPVCLSQHNIGCLGAANFAAVARPAIDCCTAHSSAACDAGSATLSAYVVTEHRLVTIVNNDDVRKQI